MKNPGWWYFRYIVNRTTQITTKRKYEITYINIKPYTKGTYMDDYKIIATPRNHRGIVP